MAYGLIVLLLTIALSAVYVFAAEVSVWSKALVVVVLAVSFVWQYGFFLRIALGICLALYFAYLQARP
jgi:membrane-anchored glycerophosphoryl diester phosphodiesterase (GDPDase)